MANPIHLAILIPSPGLVRTAFFEATLGLTQALREKRISHTIKTYAFSDIVVSRNYLVSYFLSQKQFTHALMLDCDLSFEPQQVFRLLDFGKPFCAALYPKRFYDYDKLRDIYVKDAAETNGQTPSAEIIGRAGNYIFTTAAANVHPPVKREGDFQTVGTVGTGFVLISRTVPETIVAEGAARFLARNGKLPAYRDAPHFYDFFSHRFDEKGGLIYGEDQSFCQRWVVDCGGDIWVDTKSKVNHHGHATYFGDASHAF